MAALLVLVLSLVKQDFFPAEPISKNSIPSEIQVYFDEWNARSPKSCQLPSTNFNESSQSAWQAIKIPLYSPFLYADLRSSHNYNLIGEVGPLDYLSNKKLTTLYEDTVICWYYTKIVYEYLMESMSFSSDHPEMIRIKREVDDLQKQIKELQTEIARRKNSLLANVDPSYLIFGLIIVIGFLLYGLSSWRGRQKN